MTRMLNDKHEELVRELTAWKNFVKLVGKKFDPHFDLTGTSAWLENIKDINALIERLENRESNMREILRELFNRKIWAGNIKLLQKFLKEATEEDIQKLTKIVIAVRDSSEFSEEWVEEVYALLRTYYPQVEKFLGLKGSLFNVFGELYGKLHIETEPIMNACSRRFLERYYSFTRYNYQEFKEAFEKLKEEYLNVVGKLSEDGFPINAEIDQMFNFFDKVHLWQMYPGEGGKLLNMFYNERRIFIGWGKVGDLNTLNRANMKEELTRLLQEYYPEYTSKSPKMAVKMLVNFYNMRIGDIVILKRGINQIAAICKVVEKYEYLMQSPIKQADYNHLQKS